MADTINFAKTSAASDTTLNYWLLGIQPPTLTGAWFGLQISDPGEAGTSSEPPTSGTSYKRMKATFQAPVAASGTGRMCVLASDVAWPIAQLDWGEVKFVTIHTAETGGVMVYRGELLNADGSKAYRDIKQGDTFVIDAGNYNVTED